MIHHYKSSPVSEELFMYVHTLGLIWMDDRK